MGTETEYGIVPVTSSASDSASAPDPVLLSRRLVEAAGRCGSLPVTWDYGTEHPTQDACGFRVSRSRAHPGLLTDDPRLDITNVMAPNGGRIYLDHAHPEYSAPETTNPFQALLYDKAGDRLMQEAAQEAGLILYRNNCDGRGAAWGAHENYRIKRAVPFEDLARIFLIHAVSRQIFTGSGRWGLGQEVGPGSPAGFQISQRADYCQEEVACRRLSTGPSSTAGMSPMIGMISGVSMSSSATPIAWNARKSSNWGPAASCFGSLRKKSRTRSASFLTP